MQLWIGLAHEKERDVDVGDSTQACCGFYLACNRNAAVDEREDDEQPS